MRTGMESLDKSELITIIFGILGIRSKITRFFIRHWNAKKTETERDELRQENDRLKSELRITSISDDDNSKNAGGDYISNSFNNNNVKINLSIGNITFSKDNETASSYAPKFGGGGVGNRDNLIPFPVPNRGSGGSGIET